MTALSLNPVALVLLIPLGSAAALALTPDYRWSARMNVVASFLTFCSALLLFVHRPEATNFLQIDDLNVVFVVLNTFVALTTSVFSASYIAHELETGRL